MRLLPGSIKKARLVVPASALRPARPTTSALGWRRTLEIAVTPSTRTIWKLPLAAPGTPTRKLVKSQQSYSPRVFGLWPLGPQGPPTGKCQIQAARLAHKGAEKYLCFPHAEDQTNGLH